ncbi:hypothetical protein PQO03_13845 [Lentisphaera profundi]|uniref:Lipoprotein n=1 Tax=Lentisphaera profundi TaxID=1658616 RepID=A0ABY7VYX1_9BACT|nr:hypothetical protein [Lentisphaera profundi]WDE98917.1 hypothetical protein PQO03_13845 [Lentisphaera profundi]
MMNFGNKMKMKGFKSSFLLGAFLLMTVLFLGMSSCLGTVPSHEIQRLNRLKSALAPYILPPKFDEERVKDFNLKNENIGKLAEILEPHDIKMQVSEQAMKQSFPVNGLSGFTIQRTVDQSVRLINGCWLYDDKTVFVAKDPSEFDQALQKKYEHKLAFSLLVSQQKFQISQIEMGPARLPMKVLTYIRFGGLPENLKLDNISWQDTPLKEIFSDLESAVRKKLKKNSKDSGKQSVESFKITLLLDENETYEQRRSYHFKNSSIESIISTICRENQLHSSGHSAMDEHLYIVPMHPSI